MQKSLLVKAGNANADQGISRVRRHDRQITEQGYDWFTGTCGLARIISGITRLIGGSFSVHTPEVSVCVPVIADEVSLGQCVEAVLKQSFKDFELLIVTDGSSKQTNALSPLGDLDTRIRMFGAESSKSRAAVLNACIAQARGEYIKFVQPSDILHTQCLEKFIQIFKVYRTLSLATCAHEMQDSNARITGVWRNGYTCEVVPGRAMAKKHLLAKSDFVGNLSATFFRRDYALSGIDERYFNLGEFEFWLRLAAHGDYLFLDQVLCTVKPKHNDNLEEFNRETLLAFHDYILLTDSFSQFIACEKEDAASFIEQNRAAMEHDFRRIFGPHNLSILSCKRVADVLAQSKTDFAERSFAFECYMRLCYELFTCYGDMRATVFSCREELAKRETAQENSNVNTLDDSVNDDLITLQKKYEDVCSEQRRIMSSFSWRITEPIRLLNSSVRKLRDKARISASL